MEEEPPKKKRNARPVRTSAAEIDKQIKEIVTSESEEALLMDSTSAELTQAQMALLSISQDLANALRALAEVREKVSLFETFCRSLQSQVQNLRK